MALAALDLFARVVTAFIRQLGRFHRLGIQARRTRLRVTPRRLPDFASQVIIPIDEPVGVAPFAKVVVNRLPSREIVRQQAPLTTTPQQVRQGVEDLPELYGALTATEFGRW